VVEKHTRGQKPYFNARKSPSDRTGARILETALIEYLANSEKKPRPIGGVLLRRSFDEIVYGLSRNS
jgi:hypothetical protein